MTLAALLGWPAATAAAPAATAATRDSSVARVSWEGSWASPFTIDLDTGFQPRQPHPWPIMGKAFFYASAGEVAAQFNARLVGSYDAVAAVPGRTVDVRIDPVGLSGQSEYDADGGVRFGSRYRVKIDYLWLHFKYEDYVPRLPHYDFSWPCQSNFTAFSFDNPTTLCTIHKGLGEGDPSYTVVGTHQSSCYPSLTLQNVIDGISLDVGTDCPEAAVEFQPYKFKVQIPVYAALGVTFGAELGLCVLHKVQADTLRDNQLGASVTLDGSPFTYQVPIPCDLAVATDGPREHHFTAGPMILKARGIFDYVGRVVPTPLGACVADKFSFEVNHSIGFTGEFPDPIVLDDFNEVEADFTVRIVDPAVQTVVPSGGSVPDIVGDSLKVEWGTSWGVNDVCGLGVRAYYRLRDPITGVWSDSVWINNNVLVDDDSDGQPDDQDNDGVCWWTPPRPVPCDSAQVKVELYDPNDRFLAERWGDPFLLDTQPPQVVVLTPTGGPLCAGTGTAVTWADFEPCALDPTQAFSVRLLRSGGGLSTIAAALDSSKNSFAWSIAPEIRPDSAARIVVQVRDDAGNTSADTSAVFDLVQPALMGIPQDTVKVPLDGLPVFFGATFTNGDDLVTPCNPTGDFAFNFQHRPGGPTPLVDFLGPPYQLPGDEFLSGLEPGSTVTFNFAVVYLSGPASGALHSGPALGAPLTQVDTLIATATSVGGPAGTSADTVLIVADYAPTDVPTTPFEDGGASLATPWPNPFRSGATVTYRLAGPTNVRLSIHDAAGRLVRVLVDGERPTGTHHALWDGRDGSGHAVAAGLYFIRLDAGGTQVTRTLVRLK